MNLKLTPGIHIDKWSWPKFYQFDHITFSKCILVCKIYTVLLLNLLNPNVNFITGVKVDIPSKKLHNRKYFYEKSRDLGGWVEGGGGRIDYETTYVIPWSNRWDGNHPILPCYPVPVAKISF